MIRHTIVVKASNHLKKGQLHCFLNHFQDGDCIKLSQGQQHIYLTYRLSQSMNIKTVDVNEHLLSLNGLSGDTQSSLQKHKSQNIKHLKVIVSELDWKIINANQMKIAEQFLQQITIVWPKANIPIYYDGINMVVLKVICQKVSRLDINTTIQFIQQNQGQKSQLPSDEQEEQQIQQIIILKQEITEVKIGYLNKIQINSSLKEKLKYQNELIIVQNDIEYTDCPKIQKFNEAVKMSQQNKQYVPKDRKKLLILQQKQDISQNQYNCTKICRQLLQLSQKLTISNAIQCRPNIKTLSFDIFLMEASSQLKIIQLINKESNYTQLQYQIRKQKIIQSFAQHFVEILLTQRKMLVLQHHYPYSFNNQLFLIILSMKSNPKSQDQFYQLNYIGKQRQQQKSQFINKLKRQKLVFYSQNYSDKFYMPNLHNKYEQIQKWKKIINLYKISQQSDCIKNQKINQLFKIVYESEIKGLCDFMESKQMLCLLTSFGNNGKTFMHQFLSYKGFRMWKIQFKNLNSPSLTFQDINLYLQWVICNSPYKTIFIDDLDSLCSKVQQSDQHRKKQKMISKLILTKLKNYLEMFDKKAIATAKSQSNVDQQLFQHITINLKNPSRELRQSSLNKLYPKIIEQNSQQQVNPHISQQFLQQIIENCQSFTFGQFYLHSSTLTVPTNNIAVKYDFSKLAGLSMAKVTIKNIIEKPIKYANLFKSAPIKLPRGVLLYGATGNGKSALGTAIKDQFKMKYFSVKGSDILSKYIGGSEAAVRDIFQKALSVSPSIVFFDEFESIVPKRNANNTGVNDRIVNQFLCYLDGVSSINGVFIIAATSRPDLIDPAILRPGRLDAHLYLQYPTNQQRIELIKLFSNTIKIDLPQQTVAEKTRNFSYSDLIGLFKQLRIKRSSQVLKQQSYKAQDFVNIKSDFFYQILNNFKISVNQKDQQYQKKIYQNFRDGKGNDIKKQKQIQF